MITIPLAPLAEQKRIVEQIESLFSKLDEAKEKAQEILDTFNDRKAATVLFYCIDWSNGILCCKVL